MDIQNLYEHTLIRSFKERALLKELEDKISRIAENRIEEKYLNVRLIRGEIGKELVYELFGIKTEIWSREIGNNRVRVSLAYFTSSKLPKAKRERVNEEKINYNRRGYLPYSKFKMPLWFEENFTLSIPKVLRGHIHFKLGRTF